MPYYLNLDKIRMNSWSHNFDYWFRRSRGTRILNKEGFTEYTLIVLVITIVEVRDGGAGA